MLQRLIAALLGLLGLAAAALGIASATAWRADDPLVASAIADTPTLVTEPGVLEVAGEPVTVTVRADGSPVVLVVGRDTDVAAWIGTDPHQLVTGLSDWHDLALSDGTTPEPTASADATASAEATTDAAEPSPSASADSAEAGTAADPTGSDMWVTEVTGDGSASLEWTAPPSGRWSLMAVSLGASDPTLELSWPQEVTTPWLWPGVAAGVLLIAVAVILAIRIRRSASGADWHDVSTGMIAVVTPPASGGDPATGSPTTTTGTIPMIDPATGLPLTRRQIREAEAAAIAARRGRRGATGAIPTVTGATPTVTGATPTVTGATPTTTGPNPAALRADPSPSTPDAGATGASKADSGATGASTLDSGATAPTTPDSGATGAGTPAGERPVDSTGTAAAPADSAPTGDAATPAATAAEDPSGTPESGRTVRRPWFGLRRRGPATGEETGPDGIATDQSGATTGAAPTGGDTPPGSSVAPATGSASPTAGTTPASTPFAPTSDPVGGPRPSGRGAPGAAGSPTTDPASAAPTTDPAAETPTTDPAAAGTGSPAAPTAWSPGTRSGPVESGPSSATADTGPNAARAGDPVTEPSTDATAPRRGLADRLPWRRSRDQESAAPATDGPPTAPGASTTPDDDAAPAVPGVDEEDDSLSSTQRADSWRRMWGFPADAEPDQTEADRTDREEDR